MVKRNLHSNAERRQLAISLFEDLKRYLDGEPVDPKDLTTPLADAFNSQVALFDIRKALAAAVFGCTGLGALWSASFGSPITTMLLISGAVLSAAGFVVSATKQMRLPAQFSNPEQIKWSGSDDAQAMLARYLDNLRSKAELVHFDGSIVEDSAEKGWWYLTIAKSVLSDRSKEVLKMDETTAVLVFRPEQRTLASALPTAPALARKQVREPDRNWLSDLSSSEFNSLVDEFAGFDIKGKLQPWSRRLLEHGKRFSDRHKIEDGRTFRREFLKFLRDENIQRSNGRSYEPEDLAAVFCMTNNTMPGACRRFLTDEKFRDLLRLQPKSNQQALPLMRPESGEIP